MTTVAVDAAKSASLNAAVEQMRRYRDEQTGSGEHDPDCGWQDYDEAMADHWESIADAADTLVE